MVIPPGSCLVASPPHDPVQMMIRRMVLASDEVEQSFDLGDGKCDQAGVGRWFLIGQGRQDWLWRLGFPLGGGDGADREGGHRQHDVTQERGVEPDLGVVEPEVVLAELEILFHRPAQTRDPHQGHQRDRATGRDITVVICHLAADQVFTDEQVVVGADGADPCPGVTSGSLRTRHQADLPPFPVLLHRQVLDRQRIRAFEGPWCHLEKRSRIRRGARTRHPEPRCSPATRGSGRRPRHRRTTGASCGRRPCPRRSPSPTAVSS